MRLVTPLLLAGLIWAQPQETSKPVPNYSFIDQNGKSFQLYDLRGKFVFVSFVYSRCPMPEMCQLTMTLSKKLITQWKKKKHPPPLHVLAVTLNPEYDTPAVLKKLGRQHGVDFHFFTLATGNPKVLSDFESQFDVIGIADQGMIDHNVESVLLSPESIFLKEYDDNRWTPERVLEFILKNQPKKTNPQ